VKISGSEYLNISMTTAKNSLSSDVKVAKSASYVPAERFSAMGHAYHIK
jgi:hypothetical protein